MKLIAIVLCIVTFQSFAAVPTMEGLFRNPGNKRLNGDYVVAKVLITRSPEEGTVLVNSPKQNENQAYIKLLFSYKEDGPYRLIQSFYTGSKMSPNQLVSVRYIRNLHHKIQVDSVWERRFLFSIFSMFFLNQSKSISSFINKVEPAFLFNEEVINQEKALFYKQWKKNLDNSEEIMKKPTSENDIENAPFYKRNSHIKLAKEGRNFFWKIEFENFTALFGNENHQLKKMSLSSIKGNLRLHVDEMNKFNGMYQLPKRFFLNTSKGERIVVRVLSMRVFNSKKPILHYLKRSRESLKKFKSDDKKLKIAMKQRSKFFYIY